MCGRYMEAFFAGQLVRQLIPEVYSKVELVEGDDGGVGTVLLVSFPPGL